MSNREPWKAHLLGLTKQMVCEIDELSPGADWVKDRMASCITRDFYGHPPEEWGGELVDDISTPERSRLLNELPTSNQREQFLVFLADHFSHEPHFRAHYGRYLYDHAPREEEPEDEAFQDARRELEQAMSLSESRDVAILHMRGMCARRQVKRLVDRYGLQREAHHYPKVVELVNEASQFFEEARRLNPAHEHSYVSEIQMLRDLVVGGTRRADDKLRLLAEREDLREWLDNGFWLLKRAEERLIVRGSRYFRRLRGDLEWLQGNYVRAIQVYQGALDQLKGHVGAFGLQRQIASLRYRWGMELLVSNQDESHAIQELRRARDELELVLIDCPDDGRALELWFQVYTLLPDYSPETAQEYLEQLYHETDGGLEATFGLMCIWFIRAAQGAALGYRRLGEFRRRAAELARREPSRPYAKLWLGENWRLVPDRLVPRVKPEKDERNVRRLKRLSGYVYDYTAPAVGLLRVGEGEVDLMFQPGRKPPEEPRFTQADAENRTPVTCVVFFAYDHPHAYDVKRKQSA